MRMQQPAGAVHTHLIRDRLTDGCARVCMARARRTDASPALHCRGMHAPDACLYDDPVCSSKATASAVEKRSCRPAEAARRRRAEHTAPAQHPDSKVLKLKAYTRSRTLCREYLCKTRRVGGNNEGEQTETTMTTGRPLHARAAPRQCVRVCMGAYVSPAQLAHSTPHIAIRACNGCGMAEVE